MKTLCTREKSNPWRLIYPAVLFVLPAALAAMSVLPLYADADAASTWIQDTKADFDAGVSTRVDTIYSPGDVVLASKIDTGSGADGSLGVYNTTYYTDDARSEVQYNYSHMTSAGADYINVVPNAGFAAGQEVLVIQMTGEGAGNWETKVIQSVAPDASIGECLYFIQPLVLQRKVKEGP